ncbi:MAG: murein biosynthesis integral membrane protein MurJ [Anaerolineales bacterium]|nr:murein biosynthesis integral membrane protein MurJ [Anaerolineales bacterium]
MAISAGTGGSKPADSSNRVARSTVIVMGGLTASIVFGFLRQRVIALRFGTGAELDAFTAANGVPELLFTMLAGGALAFAFIPIYTQLLTEGDDTESNLLLSRVFNTILLLIGGLGLLLAIFAPTLVRAPWGVGPHFSHEIQALTAQLMRVLFISTVIFAASSILTGALHAHQHFLLPALAPSMYSAGIILGALFLSPQLGIFGLAWGAVLGAGLHLLIQLPGAWRFRMRWRFSLGWGDPLLKSVAVLMAPRVIDLLMARASIDWINANIGSGLGVGRVSALRYAFQLMNTPWTLIGTAIGIAVFPTMSALAARRDVAAQRRALSGALRAILTLALPAAVALLVLGEPVIGFLFEGGEFTQQSTDLVYYALQFYVLALLSQSVLEVVVRAFAAQKDTLTPLIVSFFTTALNVFLAITLARSFLDGGLEHGGLALANGIAVGVEALIGLTILHFRWGGVDARRILINAFKAALAAGTMGAAIYAFALVLQPGRLMLLLGGAATGAVVYVLTALLLGLQEVRTLPVSILRGLLKRES